MAVWELAALCTPSVHIAASSGKGVRPLTKGIRAARPKVAGRRSLTASSPGPPPTGCARRCSTRCALHGLRASAVLVGEGAFGSAAGQRVHVVAHIYHPDSGDCGHVLDRRLDRVPSRWGLAGRTRQCGGRCWRRCIPPRTARRALRRRAGRVPRSPALGGAPDCCRGRPRSSCRLAEPLASLVALPQSTCLVGTAARCARDRYRAVEVCLVSLFRTERLGPRVSSAAPGSLDPPTCLPQFLDGRVDVLVGMSVRQRRHLARLAADSFICISSIIL